MEAKYFEGKTVLITGVTGFLGKVFLEKLLRVQPKVKKVFLLIRAKNEKSLQERLNKEVFGMDLFQKMKGDFDQVNDFNLQVLAKIIPISGDVSQENLGITDSELRNEICQELHIIINSSGTTKFDERYDIALETNTFGVMHIINFARKCSKLEGLLHVSTAYVHSPTAGVILETPFRMGETLNGANCLNINSEKMIMEAKLREFQLHKTDEKRVMIDLGYQRAKLHGWPNIYVFTKAMGEMILGESKEHVRIIIIRPTIISSTYKEPFPGWVEGLRTMDSFYAACGKGNLKFILGDPQSILDVIPCDMVVNCMMAAMAKHFNSNVNKPLDLKKLVIYQVGSSRNNQLNIDDFRRFCYEHLRMNPLSDNQGRLVKVQKPKFISTSTFRIYIKIKFIPLLMNLKLVAMMTFNRWGGSYAKAKRSFEQAMRLAYLYEPYCFSKGSFDDFNTETLRVESIDDENEDMFGFDPRRINWEEYFINIHFPGLVKHVLK